MRLAALFTRRGGKDRGSFAVNHATGVPVLRAPTAPLRGDSRLRKMKPMTEDRRQFCSDNEAGIHPRVMEAIAAANRGHVPSYGATPSPPRRAAASGRSSAPTR